MYFKNPQQAPTVKWAKSFFMKKHKTSYRIHVSSPTGWRTVARLPVRRPHESPHRNASDAGSGGAHDEPCPLPDIGLFQPGTHRVVSCARYPSHHPAIDAAVHAVRRACAQCGVLPYDEADGTGYLRFVAVNVERSSGRVQLTFVWNSPPYSHLMGDAGTERGEGQAVLEALVQKVTGWPSLSALTELSDTSAMITVCAVSL